MKWTKRRSGGVRTTIRVPYHVPREMVDFLQEHVGWSEAKSMNFIRENIARLGDGWHSIVIGTIDEPGDNVYVDDFDSIRENDDSLFYEGPQV